MSESPVLVEKMSTDIRKKDVNLSEVCLLEESVSLSGGSFQPMHSLLLCPAQWSALLESPISLVRQPTDDEEKADIKHISNSNMDDVAGEGRPPNTEQLSERLMGRPLESEDADPENEVEEDKMEEPTLSSPSDSDTLLLTPVGTESNEGEELLQMIGKLEEILEEAEEDSFEVGGSVNISEGSVDSKSLRSVCDDKKSEDSNSGLNLSHVLPLYPPTHTAGGSTEGVCAVNGPCDGAMRGVETPNGDRSSVPPTPSSDSRLSFSLVPSHMTHSRNISETPSLPPFINSSTSSAYHSRNSSLASQITSEWFDSDSHSTDIDSCIVMHHDLHRPISLQDPKFKLPDFSPMDSKQRQCYSFTDLSSPLHVPDNLFLPSPELENTLCTSDSMVGDQEEDCVSSESFEQKHLASGMKSSEWIKKELRRAKSSMVQVKVSSKTRHVVHFNVKAGDMFIWEFATKRKDIGFGLQFESTEVATEEQSLEEDPEDPPLEKKVAAILPTLRVNAHSHPSVGSHTATQDGVYEIVFDNSYSRFFAKDLFYRITTKPGIPNDNYLDQ